MSKQAAARRQSQEASQEPSQEPNQSLSLEPSR